MKKSLAYLLGHLKIFVISVALGSCSLLAMFLIIFMIGINNEPFFVHIPHIISYATANVVENIAKNSIALIILIISIILIVFLGDFCISLCKKQRRQKSSNICFDGFFDTVYFFL